MGLAVDSMSTNVLLQDKIYRTSTLQELQHLKALACASNQMQCRFLGPKR
jgi:hypothetical protein